MVTLTLPPSTVRLLGDAEGELGQLAGVGRLVPNPDLLLRPYLLREALSSTRIENPGEHGRGFRIGCGGGDAQR
jgi:hypothetical protein